MSNDATRRQFLVTASAAATTVFAGSLFDTGIAWAQNCTPAQGVGGSFVRRDLGGLSANDPIILSYREAIVRMRLLPYTNPLSWEYQAAIHGTTRGDNLLAWNTCTHGNAPIFFWPWHRMYLYWFERIIRKMSCNPTWALPYWNWSCPSQRHLPAMFRDPNNTPELFDDTRYTPMNSGADFLTAAEVDPKSPGTYLDGLKTTDFSVASSDTKGLQLTPHDQVHIHVGMRSVATGPIGNMGVISRAALDPLFFVHHANMDRLWDNWLGQGKDPITMITRSDPITDPTWTGKIYTFFDENGKCMTMTPCDVLEAGNQLGYTYEQECPQVRQVCNGELAGGMQVTTFTLNLRVPPFTVGSQMITVPIGVLPPELWRAIENGENANVQLDHVEALHVPGISWEVYLGLPAGVDPLPARPYFVGLFALFGSGIRDQHNHATQAANFAFVINDALLAQGRAASSLTFIPHGNIVDGVRIGGEMQSPVDIGGVSVTITKEVPAEGVIKP